MIQRLADRTERHPDIQNVITQPSRTLVPNIERFLAVVVLRLKSEWLFQTKQS